MYLALVQGIIQINHFSHKLGFDKIVYTSFQRFFSSILVCSHSFSALKYHLSDSSFILNILSQTFNHSFFVS